MMRNSVLVLGLGVLLGGGLLVQGCGDSGSSSKKDGSSDVREAGPLSDARGTGGRSTGGATGAGGAVGTGGAVSTGGVIGAGGAVGTGGATGAGGATGVDGGRQDGGGVDGPAVKFDSSVDQGSTGNDAVDVPITTDTALDGGAPTLDTGSIDSPLDQAGPGIDSPVSLDTGVDQGAGVMLDAEIDGSGVDSNID